MQNVRTIRRKRAISDTLLLLIILLLLFYIIIVIINIIFDFTWGTLDPSRIKRLSGEGKIHSGKAKTCQEDPAVQRA